MYTGSLLSGAFSGLISAGIQAGLDGKLGFESWRWLCKSCMQHVSVLSLICDLPVIIEGAITVFFALVAIFTLPDYPATTRFLSTREKAMAVYRIEIDGGSKDEDTIPLLTSLKMAACDYRVSLAPS